MTTIKTYTDLQQSEKLAEILPFKSADMYYPNRMDLPYNGAVPIAMKHGNPLLSQEIPAWSPAALLELMPATIQTKESIEPYSLMLFKRPAVADEGYFYTVEYGYRNPMTVGWLNEWYEVKGGTDLVDVLFETICWLFENGHIKTE
jgi:hypothetical protein